MSLSVPAPLLAACALTLGLVSPARALPRVSPQKKFTPNVQVPREIRCTPGRVDVPGQKLRSGVQRGPTKAVNPIAEALTLAGPGTVIRLEPGDYPPFTIGLQSHSPANAATRGGAPGNPIVIEGAPGVRIIGAEGDAIGIDQRVPNGWITFRRITIVPGRRSGVLFYQRKDGQLHQGYSFEDCHILGAWDPETGKGKRTKWGLWGQMVADFRFVGLEQPARIENISEEHAFYLQNVQGSILIENVYARDLGRTFCQFTARVGDGPAARGDVVVRDCVVEDACIAQADGYKGGSAFTLCGRMQGSFLFEHNVYRAGFRPERARFTMPGQPYGTGAFTAWEEGRAGRTDTLVLRDNEFDFAPGCGDRPVVSIGGCTNVLIAGTNRFASGGKQAALVLDPVDGQGNLTNTANGSVYLAPATKIEGRLLWKGTPPDEAALAALQRRAPPEPKPEEPPGPKPDGD